MRQNVFLGLLISFIVLGLFSIVYAVINPEQNIVSYISGSATVVIAILTMAYVYVSSKQLDVMAKQLEQIEIERRFQNQPLPYVRIMDVLVEKPNFYYSPPEDMYDAQARYKTFMKIRNIGSHPAVCIDVSAHIEIPIENKNQYFFAPSINIATIGEREDYPVNVEDDNEFMFTDDRDGILLQALLEGSIAKLPLLNCRIIFRNILGGCFLLGCTYRLYPTKEEDDSVVSNWLTAMKSFWIKHKRDVENMRGLRKSNSDKWEEEFAKLKEAFSKSIAGEDIKLSPWPIPGSFIVKPISIEEYQQAFEDVAYGVKLPMGQCNVPGMN